MEAKTVIRIAIAAEAFDAQSCASRVARKNIRLAIESNRLGKCPCRDCADGLADAPSATVPSMPFEPETMRHSILTVAVFAAAIPIGTAQATEWWSISNLSGECLLDGDSPATTYEVFRDLHPQLIDKGDEVQVQYVHRDGQVWLVRYFRGKAACEAARQARRDAADAEARSLDKYR
jgi:hypothetical protein